MNNNPLNTGNYFSQGSISSRNVDTSHVHVSDTLFMLNMALGEQI